MHRQSRLTPLQVDVSRIFFALDESHGFLLAGGSGLLASGLIARPTQDLDLFASSPIPTVGPAKEALVKALRGKGFDVVEIRNVETFARLMVSHAGEETLVDLAIDSPPLGRPTLTALGPTLAPLELAARKLVALFGRAEARDFADVYVLAERFGKGILIEEARSFDRGFDLAVLAQMMRALDRFDDDEIPLAPEHVPLARAFFANWADELG